MVFEISVQFDSDFLTFENDSWNSEKKRSWDLTLLFKLPQLNPRVDLAGIPTGCFFWPASLRSILSC